MNSAMLARLNHSTSYPRMLGRRTGAIPINNVWWSLKIIVKHWNNVDKFFVGYYNHIGHSDLVYWDGIHM